MGIMRVAMVLEYRRKVGGWQWSCLREGVEVAPLVKGSSV